MLSLDILLGFAGPLGVLCAMIVAFGHVTSRDDHQALRDTLIGLVFGAVAALEMLSPVEPFPGMIVDLRAVPLVLAGAFLGWRGLAACLLCALATRAQIGGIGVAGGLLSIVLAGYAGAVWKATMSQNQRWRWRDYLRLGLLAHVSFLGLVFLPSDMALWVLTQAILPVSTAFLTVIPVFAYLLRREQARVTQAKTLTNAAMICPDSGLLQPASFLKETLALMAREKTGAVTGLLVITPRARTAARLMGLEDTRRNIALGLVDATDHGGKAGLSPGKRILVPLAASDPQSTVALVDRLNAQLCKLDSRRATASFRGRLHVMPVDGAQDMLRAFQSADSVLAEPASALPAVSAPSAQDATSVQDEIDALFRTLEDKLLIRKAAMRTARSWRKA